MKLRRHRSAACFKVISCWVLLLFSSTLLSGTAAIDRPDLDPSQGSTLYSSRDNSLDNSLNNRQALKVAVLAFRGSERAVRRWETTMTYLNGRIPGYRFDAIPMNLEQLDQAVMDGSIDFAITNSGQYVRVGSKYGMSWLATLKSRQHPGIDLVIGSALVVKSSSGYHSLADLKNTRLGAVGPLAFGGFQIYWGEMVDQGYHPDRFFSDIQFSGFPVGALAFWVRDSLVDAAVVPACLLEKMASEGLIDLSEYRVIDAKPAADFNCLTSSKLYPNWAFSTLKSTPADVAVQVSRALLLMADDAKPAIDSGSLGWTAPVSSYDIHQLYQRLDIHPWQKPWWRDMQLWLLQNWQWSLALLLAILLGFCHHLWVQLMVQKRTRELRSANNELMQQQHQLEHAQRVAILGELASDLAHELNQPLAAINSYAEGGVIRLKNNGQNTDLTSLLSTISAEAQRGASIIERIRGFARQDASIREQTDLPELIRETIRLLDYELHKRPLQLDLDLPSQPTLAWVDPIEIQQLLVNLIRNSLEAMSDTPMPHTLIIACSLTTPKVLTLSVEDSGAGTGDTDIQTLFKPFYSTKAAGLGLGMSICRRIVEAHGGRIEMHAAAIQGTRVSCTLHRGEV